MEQGFLSQEIVAALAFLAIPISHPSLHCMVMLVPSVTIDDTSCGMLKSIRTSVSVHESLRVLRQPAAPVSSGSLSPTNKSRSGASLSIINLCHVNTSDFPYKAPIL